MSRLTLPDGLQLPNAAQSPKMPMQVIAVPSDDLLVTASVAVIDDTSSLTPVKVKEITITYPGSYRFKAFLYCAAGAAPDRCFGRVYRNGTPVGPTWAGSEDIDTDPGAGTTYRADSLIPQEVRADIGGWVKGDLAQLYVWTQTNNRYAKASNFGIWGEYAMKPVNIPAGVVLDDGVA